MGSFGLAIVLIAAFAIRVCAQKNSAPPSIAPLVLTGAIPLSNVKGRIDHFGLDPTQNRLFVSALGNNTEEIVGLSAQRVIRSINGVPTPQGVAYSPETNKLFVGSGEGKLYIYDGTTFELMTSIDFGDDVDNLRYDAAEEPVYVGYGDEKTGAIGMVDPATNKRIADEYKLGPHPESFQLAASSPNIYVRPPTGWKDMTQTAKLVPNRGQPNQWMGVSASISSKAIALGAPQTTVGQNAKQGAEYVFLKPAQGWKDMKSTAELVASDGQAQDGLGWSVWTSGKVIVGGAPYATVDGIASVGAAYVFPQ